MPWCKIQVYNVESFSCCWVNGVNRLAAIGVIYGVLCPKVKVEAPMLSIILKVQSSMGTTSLRFEFPTGISLIVANLSSGIVTTLWVMLIPTLNVSVPITNIWPRFGVDDIMVVRAIVPLGQGGYNKGAATTEGRRAAESTVVVEEGSSGVERETIVGNLCSEESLLAMNKEDGRERSLLAVLIATSSICAAKEHCNCDGNERSLPAMLCSKRSLLVMIKSLLVAIMVDGSERSVLAAIKEDGSERLLLVVIKSLLIMIKVDDSIYAA
ncbi:hypothetical protein B296_00041183 [Ensete ventricosum]|uniref:Uncharacterized protein n=1 Tax=Ensete ventricosum TaxID=4639 RepID=A0A426Y456_ENSVE|nr:hypothetical protein B296_00041183 [Ensete ventricosum]